MKMKAYDKLLGYSKQLSDTRRELEDLALEMDDKNANGILLQATKNLLRAKERITIAIQIQYLKDEKKYGGAEPDEQ